MNKEFINVRTKADIIKSSTLLVAGAILAAIPASIGIHALGYFTLIVGALLLTFFKSGWQDAETRECYRKKSVYFPRTDKVRILDAFEGRIEDIERDRKEQSEELKMQIYYNDRQAFVTLFEYIPYTYEQVSPTMEFPADRISKLIG